MQVCGCHVGGRNTGDDSTDFERSGHAGSCCMLRVLPCKIDVGKETLCEADAVDIAERNGGAAVAESSTHLRQLR